MPYALLADCVVIAHLAFVALVVCGAFLALRWRRLLWVQVPAALWGAAVELANWPCPLTPLEIALRRAGGRAGYAGGFVEHYLVPLLYPAAFSRELQLLLGAGVVAINALAYALLLRRLRDCRRVGRRGTVARVKGKAQR